MGALQVDDEVLEHNAALYDRLLSVDDVDAVHSNVAGLHS